MNANDMTAKDLDIHMSIAEMKQCNVGLNGKTKDEKLKARENNLEVYNMIGQKKKLQFRKDKKDNHIYHIKEALGVKTLSQADKKLNNPKEQNDKFQNKAYLQLNKIEKFLNVNSLDEVVSKINNLYVNKIKEKKHIHHNYISRTDNPINSRSDITNNDCFIVGERFIQNELLRSPDSFDVKSLEKGLNDQLNKVRNATQNPPVVPNDNNEQDSDNQDNNENN